MQHAGTNQVILPEGGIVLPLRSVLQPRSGFILSSGPSQGGLGPNFRKGLGNGRMYL